MDLRKLEWDAGICQKIGIPMDMLPKICSSSEIYGVVSETKIAGVSIAGILGDQQAALFGQTCFDAGAAKNTYGTGCFLMANTGTEIRSSSNGLLTTMAFQLGAKGEPHYALEVCTFLPCHRE